MLLLHTPVISPEELPDGSPCLLKAELCVFITSCLDLWMSFDFCGPCGHLSNKWQFSDYNSVNIPSFQLAPCSMTWINYLKFFIGQKYPVISTSWFPSVPTRIPGCLFATVQVSEFSKDAHSVPALLLNVVITSYMKRLKWRRQPLVSLRFKFWVHW